MLLGWRTSSSAPQAFHTTVNGASTLWGSDAGSGDTGRLYAPEREQVLVAVAIAHVASRVCKRFSIDANREIPLLGRYWIHTWAELPSDKVKATLDAFARSRLRACALAWEWFGPDGRAQPDLRLLTTDRLIRP